jgi:hypothetical protein
VSRPNHFRRKLKILGRLQEVHLTALRACVFSLCSPKGGSYQR